jgi:two-component system sensor histidine kinase DegS
VPRATGFDGPLADATAAVGASANALRSARQRYREAYQAEQGQWRALRAELDELELRIYAAGGRERSAVSAAPGAGPGAAADNDGDVTRLRDLRVRLELVESALGKHRAELARLDLVVEHLETTWLFLARNDGSPMLDPSSSTTEAGLQMRIVEAQEAERSRLAQEIHDGPAQSLTNAIFQVQYVERVLDTDAALARTELRYLAELLRRELSDVRSYISQLRPPLLDQLGLEGAIRDTIEHITALSGMEIACELHAPPDLLGEAEQTVVLRIAQEALQNIRKHALAANASVTTRLEPDGWVLEVRDDGRGFDAGAVAARGRRNFGLQFMRERAGLIGARFEVRSKADGGTTVRLAIPTSAKESR